jgi:predicted nucleic acid-binding protein
MLVLDANILIRAVLGSRVLSLLRKYADQVGFLAPESAFQEAREHLPEILERRNVPLASALALLELVTTLVQTVEIEAYSRFESVARERIDRRDEDDWPILASALALDCPIWTEGHRFLRLRCGDLDNRPGGIVPFRRTILTIYPWV